MWIFSMVGDMIAGHDCIRDNIMSTCMRANLSLVYEQKSLLPDNNPDRFELA